MRYSCPVLIASAAQAVLLASCADLQTDTQTISTVSPISGPLPLKLEPCSDRTGFKGRDLAGEASLLLEQRLRAAPEFLLREDAGLTLACEVTQFTEGSALKRWLLPGLGATVAQLAVMLSKRFEQSPVLIVRVNATVAAGGLYTVGADRRILPSAADEIVEKLRAWAAGQRSRG